MQDNTFKMIEVTERKCSPNIQKDIKKGVMYSVVGKDKLRNGTPVVIVNSRTRKGKTVRINAERFDWKEVSLEECVEQKFKDDCRRTTEQLHNNFTDQEHVRIAIIPCVLSNIAFRYGDMVRKTSAERKISILKKLSRAYDTLKEAYMKELTLDLDRAHINNIDDQASIFMNTYANDFQILWVSVHNEFVKKMPDSPHSDMRSYAICGMMIIDLLKEIIKDFDKLIQERIKGASKTVFNPMMEALRSILDAYAGEVGKFDFNDYNCQLSLKVIKNKILQIEFNVE